VGGYHICVRACGMYVCVYIHTYTRTHTHTCVCVCACMCVFTGRIDPASSLNMARWDDLGSTQKGDESRMFALVMEDGSQFCDPHAMDEIIKKNETNALRNAVVLM